MFGVGALIGALFLFPIGGSGPTSIPGGPANGMPLPQAEGLTAGADGSLLVAADTRVLRIRADGRAEVVAGTGKRGIGGDGASANAAQLDSAADVSVTADGGILIACVDRVREVRPDGTIATVAGGGTLLKSDGIQATEAELLDARGVAATADGGFLIADGREQRIRKV